MKQHLGIILSVIASVAIVGSAVAWRTNSAQKAQPQTQSTNTSPNNSSQTPPPASNSTTQISKEELAKNDGKDGHRCYVAVDGKVYEIEQGRLWKDGEHTTSSGQAHCGLDLTDSIGKSPHGKSKLEALEVVGVLQ